MRGQGINQKRWANNLVQNLDQPYTSVVRQEAIDNDVVGARIVGLEATSYATKSDEDSLAT